MLPFVASSLHWLHNHLLDPDRVEPDAISEGIRRLRSFTALVIAINLGYIAYFWWLLPAAADPRLVRYQEVVGWIHAVSAIGLTLAWPFEHYLYTHHDRHLGWQRVLQVLLCIWALAFGVSLSLADQMVGSNTTNYVMASVVVGMMALLRPAYALVLFAASYLVFFALLPLVQHDPAMLDMARSHSFSGTLVSSAAAFLLWHQHRLACLLRRELAHLAYNDPLTGLRNRGAFVREAVQELARARRYPRPTGLLVADLDYFKRVNDTYGHPAGDAVLRSFAQTLQGQLREADIVARLGGEEFIVLLPSTDTVGTMEVAEKIRRTAEATPVHHAEHTIGITTSIGVTVLAPGERALDMDALYQRADQALYAAKLAGRNRVEQR